MKTTRIVGLVTAMLALLLAACNSWASDTAVTQAMVGHWEGNARIVVAWCHQSNLPIALDIRADGTVTGKVGNAALTNGHLTRNRGWLGKKLDLKTDYIITGDLAGAIVAAESITRAGVKIPLNFHGGTFSGGVHTTGSKFGGKERMILSAASLNLARTNRP